MSESRQRYTGRVWGVLGSLLFLWILFVTLPLLARYLQIGSMDPWLMMPEDLTWQRMVFNWLTKPGLRLILVAMLAVVGWGGRWLLSRKALTRRKREYGRVSFSLEWAIDGPRNTSLIEFASFVGVINRWEQGWKESNPHQRFWRPLFYR